MKTQSFKSYLAEKYNYFDPFTNVVDKEDDELTKADAPTRKSRKAQKRKRDCEKLERGDGEEDLNPRKFRQWMELSVAVND